jgi:hypothetical protein
MSESGIGTKYRNFSPDRHEAASVFIGNLPHEAAEAASEVAESFYSKAKKPVKTAILIPVAAHQDGKLIIPALAQYAKQEPLRLLRFQLCQRLVQKTITRSILSISLQALVLVSGYSKVVCPIKQSKMRSMILPLSKSYLRSIHFILRMVN